MKGLLSNPFLKFILVAVGLYLTWYISYEFYIRENTNFNNVVIDNLIWLSTGILEVLGYDTIFSNELYSDSVGIAGTEGVRVGAPCDGIVLLALFTVFIVAFPGPWKHKAWYLPLGLLTIHLVNAIRIAALAIIVNINPDWLQFNHDYTFTILVYGYVFFLWMIWVYKFSPMKGIKI